MTIAQPSILIVGAGPVGLVLALSLLRNRVPVRIINKQLTHSVGHRGSGLHPRTLEHYKILGILPQVLERSGPWPKMRLYSSPESPDGKPLQEFSMIEELEPTAQYPIINSIMFSQDRHEALLRQVLLDEYDTPVEMGTELQSFVQTPDDVQARLVKHTAEGKQTEETARFEYVIGTDGARSVVRKQLGLSFLGESRTEHIAVTGDFELKKGIPDNRFWYGWGGGETPFVCLRPWETNDNIYNVAAAGEGMDAQRLANNHDELFDMIRTHIGPNRDLEFGKVLCLGLWSPNIRMVDKFGVGRVFIGGDAAHVHSPTGGQGLNTGVQDAFNLGWKLSLVHKKLAPASLLESYSDERLPVVAVMLEKTTLLMDKTFAENNDITSHWKREFEMRQLGVNYRGSKLVVDEKYGREEVEGDGKVDPYRGGLDGKAKGGDRAPAAERLVVLKGLEGTDTSETSLYDLLSSTKHTALVFTKENEEEKETEMLLTTVKKLFPQDTVQTVALCSQSGLGVGDSADYVVVDKEGSAFKNYNVRKEDQCRLFLIRPDGYIGAVVKGQKGMEAYAEIIFGGQAA